MTTVKFSKAFGEVEVLSTDATFTIVRVKASGEEVKLMTKFAFLQDTPFVVEKKTKPVSRKLTKQEEIDLAQYNADGGTLGILKQSKIDYKNGRSGAASLR